MRLFAAIPLPEDLRDALARLQLMLPLPRRIPPENMHLTLSFLGEVPGDAAVDVDAALVALRAAPFDLTLKGVGLFGGARPRVAYAAVTPDPALMQLHARVDTAVRAAGLAPDARRYVPHITLGRFPPGAADAPRLEQAVADLAAFRAGPVPVEAFCLFESHLGPKGPHYDELARYPLG